jgi:hypothetical protein
VKNSDRKCPAIYTLGLYGQRSDLRKTAQSHENGIALKMAVFPGAGVICKALQNCTNAGFAISSRVPSTGLSHPSCDCSIANRAAHYERRAAYCNRLERLLVENGRKK